MLFLCSNSKASSHYSRHQQHHRQQQLLLLWDPPPRRFYACGWFERRRSEARGIWRIGDDRGRRWRSEVTVGCPISNRARRSCAVASIFRGPWPSTKRWSHTKRKGRRKKKKSSELFDSSLNFSYDRVWSFVGFFFFPLCVVCFVGFGWWRNELNLQSFFRFEREWRMVCCVMYALWKGGRMT